MSAAQLGKQPFGFASVSHGCPALGSPHQGRAALNPGWLPHLRASPFPAQARIPQEQLWDQGSCCSAVAPWCRLSLLSFLPFSKVLFSH